MCVVTLLFLRDGDPIAQYTRDCGWRRILWSCYRSQAQDAAGTGRLYDVRALTRFRGDLVGQCL